VSTQAVLLAAHAYARAPFREFSRIREAVAERGDALLLWDQAGNARHADRVAALPRYEFDRDRLPDLGYPFLRPSRMLPGSTHFPLLKFARERPHDTYWFIEYDVRFTGDWRVLFEHFESSEEDFISCRMGRCDAEPDWLWWDSLTHPDEVIPIEKRLRSFNPIYRISHRALQHIDQMHRQGWRGHHEVLLPTLLDQGGFTLRDFGGTGPLVHPDDHNRFYLEPESEDGPNPWVGTGSMRWRPHFLFLLWRPRNKLFHPVSPSLWSHLMPGRSRPRKVRRQTPFSNHR
jgi:hypothetical protein